MEYLSTSQDCWIPCSIVEVRAGDGAVQVNVKLGAWLAKEEQAAKLRPKQGAGAGAASEAAGASSSSWARRLAKGQSLEYWSMSHAQWVPCQIVEVRSTDGAVQVNVKPGVWISAPEQTSRLRERPKRHSYAIPEAATSVYRLVKKHGFIGGPPEDAVSSEAAARERVLAAPETFLGYTMSADESLIYARELGSPFIKIDGWQSYVLSCKAINFDGPLFKDDICTNTARFDGGFENGKGGEPWAVWKRPGRGEGLYDRADLRLFGSISPNDAVQGSVGDCSLIACISALAEFPGAMQRLFRGRRTLSMHGRYDLQLWDWGTGRWSTVTVDDRFATRDPDALTPKFAKVSADSEIYPMLVEKAVAVMAGGYDFMNSIMPTWAFGVLTGCPAVFHFNRDASGRWTGYRAEYDGSSTFMTSAQHSAMVWDDSSSGRIPRSDSEMWWEMEAWDNQNYLLCCGIASRGRSDSDSVHGIYYMHAYSVLQVKSDIKSSGVSLAQLRNPHGRTEPDLDWRDGDKLWLQYPQVAHACEWTKDKQVDDGTFWISDVDFFRHYNTVYVLKCDMEQKGIKLGTWRPSVKGAA